MAGIQIIAKDKKGKIKQDYSLERNHKTGRKVEVNKLKKQEDERRGIEKDTERSEEVA